MPSNMIKLKQESGILWGGVIHGDQIKISNIYIYNLIWKNQKMGMQIFLKSLKNLKLLNGF